MTDLAEGEKCTNNLSLSYLNHYVHGCVPPILTIIQRLNFTEQDLLRKDNFNKASFWHHLTLRFIKITKSGMEV